jgi:hypothetical protein
MDKKEKTRIDALAELYHTLSNDDLEWLITFASERIFVWNPNDKTTYDLDPECPACQNGPKIQICLKEEE